MNFGLLGSPGLPEYTDYILGRNLATNQLWDIPFTAPVDSTVYFDFEFLDAGSAGAHNVGFIFNGQPAANHVSQLISSNGAGVAGSAVSIAGLFSVLEPAGLSFGTGCIYVGSRRIGITSQFYRGVPGASIFNASFTGLLNAPGAATLATTPVFSGLTKLQVISTATPGILKGARLRLFRPLLVNRSG